MDRASLEKLFFFSFLGPHLQPVEVPRLGVESSAAAGLCRGHSSARSELQQRPTHSSRPHQILNPLSGVGDWTLVLMDTSWVCYHCATTGTPTFFFFLEYHIMLRTFEMEYKNIIYIEFSGLQLLCKVEGICTLLCSELYQEFFTVSDAGTIFQCWFALHSCHLPSNESLHE